MRFRTSRALALIVSLLAVALVGPVGPAGASTTVVDVANYAFTPSAVQVSMGSTVSWHFHADHTSTSNQGFWNSGERMSGSFNVVFPDAGSFGYHCTMHPSMTGVVRVPMNSTGRPLKGYRLTWSIRSMTPVALRYDVQYKLAGAKKWSSFRTATSSRFGKFNPSRSGNYLVRARTRKAGRGASGWSPALHLKIS